MHNIGLFVPSEIDQFSPKTAWSALHLLESLGLTVTYPTNLTTCGMELYNQGDFQTAKQLGEKMIEQYDSCSYIVSLGSSCAAYIHKRFSSLFHNTTMHNEYRGFVERFMDISDFLANIIHYEPTNAFPHRVAFMDNCQSVNDYQSPSHPNQPGLLNEPRQLLKAVPELELVEMQQGDVCCGYGGLFANRFTVISDRLAQQKIDNAIAAKAEFIVSTDMGCLLHLKSYAEKKGANIGFMHIVDILGPDNYAKNMTTDAIVS